MTPGRSPTVSDEKAQLRARIDVLDAYLLAASRRQEIVEVASQAETPEEARRAVAELLDITESAAWAVLELRLHRFTRSELRALQSELETVRGAARS